MTVKNGERPSQKSGISFMTVFNVHGNKWTDKILIVARIVRFVRRFAEQKPRGELLKREYAKNDEYKK